MSPQDWLLLAATIALVALPAVLWIAFRWVGSRIEHRDTAKWWLWQILRWSRREPEQVRALRELFSRKLGADDLRLLCLIASPMNSRKLGEALVDGLSERRSVLTRALLCELACGAFEWSYAAEAAKERIVQAFTFEEKLELKELLTRMTMDDDISLDVAENAESLLTALTTGRGGIGAGVFGLPVDLEIRPWTPPSNGADSFRSSLADDEPWRGTEEW